MLASMLMTFSAVPALAAERALTDVVGYSGDGRYFAFEEFGVQDGSGFAYSTYYVIDLNEDRWVVGTPIARVGESEDETLAAIRAAAAAAATPRLGNLGIDVPAFYVAGFGDGVLDTDAHQLAFGLPRFASPGSVAGRYVLDLEIFGADAASPCLDWFGASAKGFVAHLNEGGPALEVHRDGVLPRSRGCPEDYRIYGIYVPFEASDLARGVALISYYPHGFEGLDRRFLALPLVPGQDGR